MYALLLLLVLALLPACGKPPGFGDPSASVASLTTGNAISYATLSKAVFQSKCTGCHNSQQSSGGIDLSTYAAVMSTGSVVPGAPDASRLYLAVNSGSMPQGGAPLSPVEVAAIRTWIASGAPEAGTGPTPAPTPTTPPGPTAPTFSAVSSTVLQVRCVSCHSGSRASSGIDLSTYASVMASGTVMAGSPSQSSLYNVTSSGSMPQGGSPLSSSDLQLISDWISSGAPNN